MSTNHSAELDALRAQVARLQAEKNDLVALNSELQLKADQDSHDGSFIEIIRVSVRSNTYTDRSHYLTHNKNTVQYFILMSLSMRENQRLSSYCEFFFSGWGGRWHEQRVWFRAHQMSRPEPHGLPTGQRGGNRQPAPPVAEERDAAGWTAAGRAAVLRCQVQGSSLKGQFTAFYK